MLSSPRSSFSTAALLLAGTALSVAHAEPPHDGHSAHTGPSASSWQWGAVLDVGAASRALELGQREQGLSLGHSDLSVRGPLGRHLDAQATAAVHTHEGKTEAEIEEAYVQTNSLPLGLQLRAGRFASQLGYLNEQHPHADDFVERPLLHRAFLGGHWYDDGLRLNWTAPTELYLRLGAEVFRGRQLIPDSAFSRNPGAATLSVRLGGDIGRSHSWQTGLSWLHNRRVAPRLTAHDDHDHDDDHGHDDHDDHDDHGHDDHHDNHAGHDHGHEGHSHAHGANFSGRNLYLWDLTWKWAPDGNNSHQQVRVSYERAWVRDLGGYAVSSDRHASDHLSVVWRFAPTWEAGIRSDWLKARQAHGDHFHDGRLRETSVMLAYKPTHAQSLRLQATRQHSREGFEHATHAVQLQYVLSFGAHAAHAF